MQKVLFTLIILTFSLSVSYPQDLNDYTIDPDSSSITLSDPGESILSDSRKIRTGMQIGTGISIFNKVTTVNSFLAPRIEYSISPRLRISTGMFLVQSSLLNSPQVYSESAGIYKNNRFANTMIFAQGHYQLNKKVTINSLVVRNISNIDQQTNNPYLDYNFNSYSFGLDYQISEGAGIGFQIQFNEGRIPYSNNTSFFNRSPFYSSPFRSGDIW